MQLGGSDMGRLSLVIADHDAEYIRNLEKYIMINYPKRFEILSFSAADSLCAYLKKQPQTDILLVNCKMIDESIKAYNHGVVMVLTEHESEAEVHDYESVKKFQHIDNLVSEIVRLYTSRSNRNCRISGNKHTRIVSIISPSGGTGKSCIAAGCSIISAGRGFKAFYLNFESIPSTEAFFNGDSMQNFSKVIYHLKGSNNLWLRLEAAKCIDIKTDVHYFKPPENISEMDELDDQDMMRLISEFKSSGVYDYAFIDMSAGLDRKNSSILRCSDIIVLVLTDDAIMQTKVKEFQKSLELLENKWKEDIHGKILSVCNFAGRHENHSVVCCYEPIAMIPYCPIPKNNYCALVNNVSFISSVNHIVDYIVSSKSARGISISGGGSVA
jgi:cellulose biosynthesis protein BcsQ